jgi:hypothetical protein
MYGKKATSLKILSRILAPDIPIHVYFGCH